MIDPPPVDVPTAKPTLVVLYGPPAVGKLTIARELSKRRPFKLLHNHATIDPVLPFFEYGTRPFWEVVGRFRHHIAEVAAREGVDLIYTYVFASGEEAHIERIAEPYEAAGGRVCLVQLLAPLDELQKRVVQPSRREFRKGTDPEHVAETMARYDLTTPVAGRPSLTIDTTQLTPDAAADAILAYLDGHA
jgi:hypothetical protein